MLTETSFRNLKPGDKDRRLSDGGGLHLFVTTKGHRSWRLKYRFAGKEERLIIGTYPEVSLKEARARREDVKADLRAGRDPKTSTGGAGGAAVGQGSGSRGKTFEVVAREWFALHRKRWKPIHASDVIGSLKRDLFPIIGDMAIVDIDPPILLDALRKIEARGAIETAARVRQRAGKVFGYAIATGIARENPAASVKDALEPPPPKRKWPAIVDLAALRVMTAKIDVATASPLTRLASRFLGLTAQRPGMVRGMPWDEIEGVDWSRPPSESSDAIWHVTAARMKLELRLTTDEAFNHLVPLSRQAVETLHVVRTLTGSGPLVFCSIINALEPMSENAIGYLYNREGFQGRHVPHGWRLSFSTIMNASTGWCRRSLGRRRPNGAGSPRAAGAEAMGDPGRVAVGQPGQRGRRRSGIGEERVFRAVFLNAAVLAIDQGRRTKKLPLPPTTRAHIASSEMIARKTASYCCA